MGAAPGLGSNSLEPSQGKLQALSSVSGSGLKCWGLGQREALVRMNCPRTDLLCRLSEQGFSPSWTGILEKEGDPFPGKTKKDPTKALEAVRQRRHLSSPLFHCSLQSHLFQLQPSPAQEKTPLNTGDTGWVKDSACRLISTQGQMLFQFLSGLALWELLPVYLQAKDTAIRRGRWTVDSF